MGNIKDKQSTIESFQKAVDQASFVLKENPELVFPQIYNRLQWSAGGEGLLKEKIESGRNMYRNPWFHIISRPSLSERLLRTLSGHTEAVGCCAFSPDGKKIASGSSDNTIRIWEVASGRELYSLEGHTNRIESCIFSSDGKRIFSWSEDKTVRVWDIGKGKELFRISPENPGDFCLDGKAAVCIKDKITLEVSNFIRGESIVLEGSPEKIISCALSPNGKFAAAPCTDQRIRIWDLQTGKIFKTLNGFSGRVHLSVFSPDGRRFISVNSDRDIGWSRFPTFSLSFSGKVVFTSYDDRVKLWDIDNWAEIAQLKGSFFFFSPDSRCIAAIANKKEILIWDSETGREIAALKGHTDKVEAVTFSPDGMKVATASWDKTLRLWDGKTGEQLAVLEGHTAWVMDCVFSPDGKIIVSAGFDKTLKLWETASGKEISTLTGHASSIAACAFSPDGQLIVSAGADKTLKLWRAEGEQELLSGHKDKVNHVQYSHDGKWIVSSSADATLKTWDAESGQELHTFSGHKRDVLTFSISPRGGMILSGSIDKTLKLWDSRTGEVLDTLVGHKDAVSDCAFSPDGKRFVSASWDKSLRLWDGENGKELADLHGHKFSIYNCVFSPDGQYIFSGGSGDFKCWDSETGKELEDFDANIAGISALSFSPDGKYAVTKSYKHSLTVWEVESWSEISHFMGHTESVQDFSFSPDGKKIVSCGGTQDMLKSDIKIGELKLWKAESGEELLSFKGHEAQVCQCLFSIDGKRIISASKDKTLRLWDAETAEELAVFSGFTGKILTCTLAPNGKRVVLGDEQGQVLLLNICNLEVYPATKITSVVEKAGQAELEYTSKFAAWDMNVGRRKSLIGHEKWVSTCGFSPDGNLIATGSQDGTINVYDAHTGDVASELKGHSQSVSKCLFSPDGTRILSASADKTLRYWSAHTGDELLRIERFNLRVEDCDISPDGKYAVSCSYGDKTLRLWELSSGKEIRVFTGHRSTVNTCSFHPDGRLIVSGAGQHNIREPERSIGEVKLWDVWDGTERFALHGHEDEVRKCKFSADGSLVASVGNDATVRVWNVLDGRRMATLRHRSIWMRGCDFSPNGEMIVTCGGKHNQFDPQHSYGELYVWKTDGAEIARLDGHSDEVLDCAFASGGKVIISAARDLTIRIWASETLQEFDRLQGYMGEVMNMAVSPDSRQIVLGDTTGRVCLLSLDKI